MFGGKKSVEASDVFVVAGLGNPGAQYERTWHNAGFIALDRMARRLRVHFEPSKKLKGEVAQLRYQRKRLFLLKPDTFMNRSGESLSAIQSFYKIPSSQLLVFYDDVDLPLGASRLRWSGGSGTHNGMRSLLSHIGKDFPRARIGVGPVPKERDLADFVLSKMQNEELAKLETVCDRLIEATLEWIETGDQEKAMRLGNVTLPKPKKVRPASGGEAESGIMCEGKA